MSTWLIVCVSLLVIVILAEGVALFFVTRHRKRRDRSELSQEEKQQSFTASIDDLQRVRTRTTQIRSEVQLVHDRVQDNERRQWLQTSADVLARRE